MQKIFVLGPRYSGKTPFSIELSESNGLQHIEASNWLRKLFESTDFAMMLLDSELMNRLTVSELQHNPNACTNYVRHKLAVGRPAIVDGLFELRDFKNLFDADTDSVVRLEHLNSSITPTSYEEGLSAIDQEITQLVDTGELPEERVFRYSFQVFRDQPGVKRRHFVDDGTTHCTSLAYAIELAQAERQFQAK